MLSRARSLTQLEAQAEEAQVGKLGSTVELHPPSMRQAIAWELALRNIRQTEVGFVLASVCACDTAGAARHLCLLDKSSL